MSLFWRLANSFHIDQDSRQSGLRIASLHSLVHILKIDGGSPLQAGRRMRKPDVGPSAGRPDSTCPGCGLSRTLQHGSGQQTRAACPSRFCTGSRTVTAFLNGHRTLHVTTLQVQSRMAETSWEMSWAMAVAAVRPGDSMPRSWRTRGNSPSGSMTKSAIPWAPGGTSLGRRPE